MAHSLFKPKRTRNGKRIEGRYWWGQFRLDGDEDYTRFSLKTTDKRVAQQRLNEIIQREERQRAGILAPEAQSQAAGVPIAEHLRAFVAYLRGANRSREYVRKIDQRVNRLMTECRWRLLRDVSAESFLGWRARQSLSAKTLNDYQDALYALLNWLKQTQRLPHNPIEHVGKVDGRGRRSFLRRAFTDDEAERLLSASGPRRAVYFCALHTGLRKGELQKLRWADVDLDRGVLRLRAEATKARRADVLPISLVLAQVLAELRQNATPSAKVFAGGMPSHHTFQADLKRAGIEKTNAEGRKVDFHALRTTFITNLQRAGVSQRAAMALARHTDPRLTAHVYTDTNALPLADAVATLPSYAGDKAAQGAAQEAAHGAAQAGVFPCPALSRDDTARADQPPMQSLDLQELIRALACHFATRRDTEQKWSRGESNPRAVTVPLALLRV